MFSSWNKDEAAFRFGYHLAKCYGYAENRIIKRVSTTLQKYNHEKDFIYCFICRIVFLSDAQNLDGINCLKFTSIAEYEAAIENYAINGFSHIRGFSGYSSMKSSFIKETPPEGFDEEQPEDNYDVSNDKVEDESKVYSAYEVLSELLNTDKVMIIGNWIIKVDLENERGLLLNTRFADQYSDVLNNNLSNININCIRYGY
jgi:hypothetical protein